MTETTHRDYYGVQLGSKVLLIPLPQSAGDNPLTDKEEWLIAVDKERIRVEAERDAALRDAETWRQRYEDFKIATKRHADGLLALLVRAEERKKEEVDASG